jgi:hypothetical protein
VFENRLLRRMFGPRIDEMAGGWWKLQMRSFITCIHRIIRIVKSRKVRWAGHVARMRREEELM